MSQKLNGFSVFQRSQSSYPTDNILLLGMMLEGTLNNGIPLMIVPTWWAPMLGCAPSERKLSSK